MAQIHRKIFTVIDSEITCEYKLTKNPSGTIIALHNHNAFEIMLILSGDITFYMENSGTKLVRGDIVCIQPYDFHRANITGMETYERIVINFSDTVLRSSSSKKSDLSSCLYRQPSKALNVIHLTDEQIPQFVDLATSLESTLSHDCFGSDLLADSYFKQIMVMLNRNNLSTLPPPNKYPRVVPKLVVDTISYINANMAEEITLKKLESQFHHSGAYISKCFKSVTGTSLQQYIISKKIAYAQTLLRTGHSPSDVCYMAGFNNYSNFSRTFSNYANGLSPKQYQLNTLDASVEAEQIFSTFTLPSSTPASHSPPG